MATIDVKISQAVMDSAALGGLASEQGAFATAMEAVASVLADLPHDDTRFTSATMADGTVRITYPDGAYREFTGVTLAPDNATRGAASATGMKLVAPGTVSIEEGGKFGFTYTTAPSLQIHATSAVADSITVKTLYAANSPELSAVYGNVSAHVDGHLAMGMDGQLRGSFDSLTLTADKFLASATLAGHFNISGDAGAIEHPDAPGGGGLDQPVEDISLDGKATALDLEFRDGSYLRGSDLGVQFNIGQFDDMLGLVHGALSGNDTIKVDLPAVLPDSVLIPAGAGDDRIFVAGGGGKLDVLAGAGNDTITMLSAHHRVDGGAGTDTVVFSGAKSQYTITQADNQLQVAWGGGVDVLTNVERLQFSDGALAYDVDGSAGQAWRMYRAVFDRDPDLPGLGFWIKSLDQHVSIRDLAAYFINSAEFTERFGEHLSDAAFVARLYNNVLHRGYDQQGYDYWVDVLAHGEARANVLANFSESAENKVKVMGSIEHGCDFMPYGA